MHQVVQLGFLQLAHDGVVVESVHDAGEPPAEALGAPDALEAFRGIVVDACFAAFGIELGEGVAEVFHVGGGQVQAFGAGGRHDVAGVARKEHAAKAQRLGHKAAQRGNAFFNAGAGDELVGSFAVQAQAQFGPKGVVAPLLHLVGQRHLQVIAAAGVAAL